MSGKDSSIIPDDDCYCTMLQSACASGDAAEVKAGQSSWQGFYRPFGSTSARARLPYAFWQRPGKASFFGSSTQVPQRAANLYFIQAMARYAQNTTIGNTCPWGAGDASLPDAFTLAAQKAARRRESKEGASEVPEVSEAAEPSESPKEPKATARSEAPTATARSAASRASRVSRLDTGRMMNLIEKCLDKKVDEMRACTTLRPPSNAARSVRSGHSVRSAETVSTQPEAPSHIETDTSVT